MTGSARAVNVLRRHLLTSYFALAFALSWMVSLPHVLWVWGVVPNDVAGGFMLKQWVGPALAAMGMAVVAGGRPGLKQLRSTGRRWRVRPIWYLATLVGPALLILLGVLPLTGSTSPSSLLKPGLIGPYLGYFVLVFIAVGLPEELGWRGFALPRLQERFGPLRASLLLGAMWALWHLAFFLTPDHGGGPGTDPAAVAVSFLVFTGMVVAMAIVFTFVFNRTGGSVFMTALLHTSIDTSQLVWLPLLLPVGLTNSTHGELVLNLALLCSFGLAAAVIVVATRGRLGLPSHHSDADTTADRAPSRSAC